MFDARIRPWIDPPLNLLGKHLASAGVSANAVTAAGALLALAAVPLLATQQYGLAAVFIALSRLMDGLDGAIARQVGSSPLGGYLDIVADFVFYTAVPVGFALANPDNALPAALLLASFALTGVSFLAFAVVAGKLGLETSAHGPKSFFYSTGLTEGAETIALFFLMCARPDWFAPLAMGFAAACLLTVVQRTLVARRAFALRGPEN